MPKVCSLPAVSRFAATLVFWSICGLAGIGALGCNQEKPQDLNPPPADSTPISGKTDTGTPAAVPTQPPVVTPAPAAPTTPDAPVTKPVAGADGGETHITGTHLTTEPAAVAPTTEPIAVVPPTTVPSLEPATAPTGSGPSAPATNPADSGQSRPAARRFTGTLHGGVLAAGSETTGWALHVDGATGALDIDVTGISGQVKALDGRHVTIVGQLKEKDWLERGKTQLLIAETIAVAPLPDMNK